MKILVCITLYFAFQFHDAKADEKMTSSIKYISSKLDQLAKDAAETRASYIRETGRSNMALDYLLESVFQAEHSARHAFEKLKEHPIPKVGNVTKDHVIREIRAYLFQTIGFYGVIMFSGMILYYAISSLLLSGSFFVMLLSSLPFLFTSVLFFPVIFFIIEALFGLSYFSGLISYYGIGLSFGILDFLLSRPDLLENIGMAMLIIGVFSLFFREIISLK